MKIFFRKIISKLYTLSRVYNDLQRLKYFIDLYKINLVFDIGANTGQFAKSIRRYDYKDQIISIEPLQREFKILNIHFREDKKFKSYNYALGCENKKTNINVAENSVSSSLYEPNLQHYNVDKRSQTLDKEKIELIKLDDLIKLKKIDIFKNTMLKIDTQGSEMNILLGANNFLKSVKIILLELSFKDLYNINNSYIDILDFLDKKNFKLIDFFYGVRDKKNNKLIQADILLEKI